MTTTPSPSAPSTEGGIGDLPERLHGFALMHIAMRRDADRLVAAAGRLTPSTTGPVAAWWSRLRTMIEHHHRSEDEVFWPAVAARVPGFTAAGALADDHVALDRSLAEVSASLERGADPAGVPEVAERFRSLLRAHLRAEEAVVLPACEAMPAREYSSIEARLVRTAPLAVLTFIQPWMFDGASAAAVRVVSADIPAPARLLGRTAWRRQYDRLVGPVRRLAGD